MQETVAKLLSEGKGILAADESNSSSEKRFKAEGLPTDAETRRKWRQLLLTSEGIEKHLNGVILYDETIRQSDDNGKPFVDTLREKDILIGIKVDLKTRELLHFPGEVTTQGLTDLDVRLKEYSKMGAKFAKWRAVIRIGFEMPSRYCIDSNVAMLTRYAEICHANNIVPIVEPEIIYDGEHDMIKCFEVMSIVYFKLFKSLQLAKLDLGSIILKSSMVLPGKQNEYKADAEEVGEKTVAVFRLSVPETLGGIVLLSGGQSPSQAVHNLNEINKQPKSWTVTFSFSRAIQQDVFTTWMAKDENIEQALKIYMNTLARNSSASMGKL